MKLHLPLLSKIVDIPSDLKEARNLLDDLGLEVKDIDVSRGYPEFNIETLANRGDHLHALGIAREISARLLTTIRSPAVVTELPDRPASLLVRSNTEACSRYALLEITLAGDISVPSDVSLIIDTDKDRHPIVDILNYVQMEVGQPMHAFDHEKVEGEIRVELSSKEEEILALDGKTYRVPGGSILICDRKKIIAVGGVIGCANSMVSASTTRVLIESAAFDPVSVRLTARGMGISTDASYKFERGSDREGCVFALRRVAQLLKGAVSTVSGQSTAQLLGFSYYSGIATEVRKISINPKTIRNEMNLPRLNEAEIKARLKNLGYLVEESAEKIFKVTVPSWRLWDVFNQADLVEDFVRSHGINSVKMELPALSLEQDLLTPIEKVFAEVEPVLLGNGFFEVITEPFYGERDFKRVVTVWPEIQDKHVLITNALERECSHLKVTNIIHLANLSLYNHRRGVSSVKIFEVGKLFGIGCGGDVGESGFDHEREVLTFALSGRWVDNEFRKSQSIEESLFFMKGVIEDIFSSLGSQMQIAPSSHAVLHPGRQAAINVGKIQVGFFGEIHPALAREIDLKQSLIYVELDLRKLLELPLRDASLNFSEFPAVWRDITVQVPLREYAEKVSNAIKKISPVNLSEIEIVDDFRREEETFRRVSYRLIFQSRERTLESQEVDGEVAKLIETLSGKFNFPLVA